MSKWNLNRHCLLGAKYMLAKEKEERKDVGWYGTRYLKFKSELRILRIHV